MKKTKSTTLPTVAPQGAKAGSAVVESVDVRKAREISQQYGVLANKANAFIQEAIKFGAILIEWEQFLGKSQGGYGSGGSGLKNWLEQNCPEIQYKTAMKYKLLAEKNAQMLGGGAMALAALQGESTVRQPDGEVVDVECKVIEKRDEIFSEANSFQKLEQMWLDLFGTGDKPKAKKKAAKKVASGEGLSMGDSATMLWAGAMRVFEENRAAFHSAARDLRKDVAGKFLEELKMLVGALEERVGKK